MSGRGRVATFTVNHHPWVERQAPYVIAIVELDEQPGLRLTANLVQVDADQVRIGLSVRAAFVAVGGRHVPVFRPEGGPA